MVERLNSDLTTVEKVICVLIHHDTSLRQSGRGIKISRLTSFVPVTPERLRDIISRMEIKGAVSYDRETDTVQALLTPPSSTLQSQHPVAEEQDDHRIFPPISLLKGE